MGAGSVVAMSTTDQQTDGLELVWKRGGAKRGEKALFTATKETPWGYCYAYVQGSRWWVECDPNDAGGSPDARRRAQLADGPVRGTSLDGRKAAERALASFEKSAAAVAGPQCRPPALPRLPRGWSWRTIDGETLAVSADEETVAWVESTCRDCDDEPDLVVGDAAALASNNLPQAAGYVPASVARVLLRIFERGEYPGEKGECP